MGEVPCDRELIDRPSAAGVHHCHVLRCGVSRQRGNKVSSVYIFPVKNTRAAVSGQAVVNRCARLGHCVRKRTPAKVLNFEVMAYIQKQFQ